MPAPIRTNNSPFLRMGLIWKGVLFACGTRILKIRRKLTPCHLRPRQFAPTTAPFCRPWDVSKFVRRTTGNTKASLGEQLLWRAMSLLNLCMIVRVQICVANPSKHRGLHFWENSFCEADCFLEFTIVRVQIRAAYHVFACCSRRYTFHRLVYGRWGPELCSIL